MTDQTRHNIDLIHTENKAKNYEKIREDMRNEISAYSFKCGKLELTKLYEAMRKIRRSHE